MRAGTAPVRAGTAPPMRAGTPPMRAGTAPPICARPGAALLLVLLLLFLLDCVVLGSVHLALLERRLAQNVDTALRLRLFAESAVRSGAAAWDVAADSLAVGALPHVMRRDVSHDSIETVASIQRLGAWTFLLRSDAALRPPRAGRAAAALLLRPPPLPPDIDALADDVIVHFERLVALFDPPDGAASRYSGADFTVTEDFAGTLIVDGDLSVTAGVTVRGLVIVRGTLVVESDARIEGAVHAGGASMEISGTIEPDAAAVEMAIADAGLREPRALRGRAWIPAF